MKLSAVRRGILYLSLLIAAVFALPLAAATPAASPVCIQTGSNRTAPQAMWVALRQTGTRRLSTPCGGRSNTA